MSQYISLKWDFCHWKLKEPWLVHGVIVKTLSKETSEKPAQRWARLGREGRRVGKASSRQSGGDWDPESEHQGLCSSSLPFTSDCGKVRLGVTAHIFM